MKHKKGKIARFFTPRQQFQKQSNTFFSLREKGLNDREKALIEREQDLEINKHLLDDTLHEIRKINNQLNGNILELTKAIDQFQIGDIELEKHIYNILKTMEGNSTLLSIRMDAYDIMLNPVSASKELEYMMGVYGKVEKVYKCLYTSRKAKNLEIHLNGRSERKFKLRNSMELAFFIIIENAIKYSPENEDINIDFKESKNDLVVDFCNWAICPKISEMDRLTERGFRSKMVLDKQEYTGRGLGLYLLKQICEANNVGCVFRKENEVRVLSGITCNLFKVTLSFSN